MVSTSTCWSPPPIVGPTVYPTAFANCRKACTEETSDISVQWHVPQHWEKHLKKEHKTLYTKFCIHWHVHGRGVFALGLTSAAIIAIIVKVLLVYWSQTLKCICTAKLVKLSPSLRHWSTYSADFFFFLQQLSWHLTNDDVVNSCPTPSSAVSLQH